MLNFLKRKGLNCSSEQVKAIAKDGFLGAAYVGKEEISEGLKYHIDNNISLTNTVYRENTEKYYSLLSEAKALVDEGKLLVDDDTKEFLSNDIGKFANFEGIPVPLDSPMEISKEVSILKAAAEYQGKKVNLNKPRYIRKGEPGHGRKQYVVYVKDGDKVKRIVFGDPDLRAKPNNPDARKSFKARHKCDQKKDKTTPGYWACNFPPKW